MADVVPKVTLPDNVNVLTVSNDTVDQYTPPVELEVRSCPAVPLILLAVTNDTTNAFDCRRLVTVKFVDVVLPATDTLLENVALAVTANVLANVTAPDTPRVLEKEVALVITSGVLVEITLLVIVIDDDTLPIATDTGVTTTEPKVFATVLVVAVDNENNVELPTSTADELATTFAPTATADVLARKMPVRKLPGSTFADVEELAT